MESSAATPTTDPLARSPEVLREEALRRLRRRRDFHAHLFIYTAANAVLWAIWLVTGTAFPWPVFVTLGWGIGLAADAWDTFARRPITEAEVEREVARLRRVVQETPEKAPRPG